jgi:hypothetical protein
MIYIAVTLVAGKLLQVFWAEAFEVADVSP